MFILEMLKFNILAAAIILITLLVSRILKNKYSVRWRYWTWLVVAVLLLLPFHFTALRPVIQVNVPRETSVQMADVQETTGGNGTETTGGSGLETGSISKTETVINSSVQAENIESPVPEQTAYVSASLPVDNTASDREVPQAVTQVPETAALQPSANPKNTLSTADLEKGFVYIWIAGIACVFVVRMLKYIAVKRKLGKYRHRVDTQEVLSTYVRLCRKLGIQKPPVLYLQPALQSPLLTGLLKPSLYLPGEAYTAVELELIFLHELHHFRHKDLWYKFFLSIPGIIYWFNPAIAVMRREANRDLEAICDSEVIRFTGNPQKSRAYGRLLLQTSMEPGFIRQAALGLNDSVTDFKERIKYMLSTNKRKSGLAVCLLLCAVLILTNQLVGCSSAKAADNESQTDNSVSESSRAAASVAESIQTSDRSEPNVYETKNFTFTVPEIWQGQVTGRVEAGPVFDKLILEWNDFQLATIKVEDADYFIPGDAVSINAWHSEEEGGNHVVLSVKNYAFLIPEAVGHSSDNANMLNALTDEEKEQLLYLSTGGSINLEKAEELYHSSDEEIRKQMRVKTAFFYNESIAPFIAVKDISDISFTPDSYPVTYETKYFTFTVPEIWQGQVMGLIKEDISGNEYLSLEWQGISLASISLQEKAHSVAGDIGTSRIWHSEGQNSNYWVCLTVQNFAYYLPTVDVRAAAEDSSEYADRFFKSLSALTDEEKEQLLYLTTGGRVTLENVAEGGAINNTADFYEEFIIPNIVVKELPPRETETAGTERTTFETRYFSFTMPEIWQGKVAGRIVQGADSDVLDLEWKGIHLARIQIGKTEYAIHGFSKEYGEVWYSEGENGYQLAIWTHNYVCSLGYNEVYHYFTPELDGLPDEDKEELIYLSTGGSLTLEEAIELCRSEQTVGQTSEKIIDFFSTYIAPCIEVKEWPSSQTETAVSETTFETKNFTFTVPEIWQGQVTGKIEGEPGAEKLTFEWHDIPLAWIAVERSANSTAGDISSGTVWHSEDENGFRVYLSANNYVFLIPVAEQSLYQSSSNESLRTLTDEEKEQLLYLTTGGTVSLEEARDYYEATDHYRSNPPEDKKLPSYRDFYRNVIAPNIEVTDLQTITIY